MNSIHLLAFKRLSGVWVVCFAALGLTLMCHGADTNLPTTWAELDRWYVNPPPDENAASNYVPAFAAIKVSNADSNSLDLPIIGHGPMPLLSQPVPGAMRDAIAKLVEENQPALDLLKQASRQEQCRYPTDFSHGPGALLPQLREVKQAAQVLELAAISQALAGDGRQAAKYISVGFATANSLKQEPILISQFVRYAGNNITVWSLEQVMNRIALPPGALYDLERTLKPIEADEAAGNGLFRAFAGERAMQLQYFEMTPEEQAKWSVFISKANDSNPSATISPTNLFAGNRQFYDQAFDEASEAMKSDYPQRFKAAEIYKRWEVAARDRQYIKVARIFSSMVGALDREASSLAYLRLARTAIALERYRRANDGKYPDSLDSLAPSFLAAVPTDPFDGQPLRYHKKGTGYFLYSIGPDREDDGGVRIKNGKGDLVFGVINPPKAAQ